MRHGLQIFIATMIFASFIFGLLIYRSISGIETQAISFQEAQGKQVFQRKACVECHTVFGNGGYWGGDLTKVYDRYGHDRITAYLTTAPVLGGAKDKRHEQLTVEEAEKVTAYLKFINSINTLDWPPHANR